MAVREIKSVLSNLTYSLTELVFGKKQQRFKYAKYVSIGTAAILALIVAFFAYRWYVVYREQAAQKMWAEQLAEYHNAMQSGESKDFEHAALQFQFAYEQNRNSNTAPYMRAFQANALAKQGKVSEAIEIQSQLLDELSRTSPLYPLLRTKRALLMLDAEQETIQQEGLQELIEVAHDKENIFNDMALYYLGRYYWAHDDVAQAQKAWQELVDSQLHEQIAPSPWAKAAEQSLSNIK